MVRISIAMATYNGESFIEEQLESIASQTRQPDELVVADDCSTDTTLALVQRFANRAQFAVHTMRNDKNLGFNTNFERALAHCSGDLIFISDQDDVWFPQKIDRVANKLDQHPDCLALIHDEQILDQKSGQIFERTYFGNQRALGFQDSELVSGNCTALRRELLEILQPFPSGINYDYWIGWMADVLNCRVVLREPLQLYRRHASNSSEPVLAERRPSPWSVLWRNGLPDPRPAWSETLEHYRLLAARIHDRPGAIERLLGAGRAEASIEKLSQEISALQQRIEVISLPAYQRRIEILRNWRRGFYRQFSGHKSAIKDLLQP
jgi:glycosyltransferase involved in cell wall biosynthesis